MKISFYGSSIFSLKILESLHELHKQGKVALEYVVTQPPKEVGRKGELTHNLIGKYCLEHQIQFYTPNKLSELLVHPEKPLEKNKIDIALVAAYGKIISKKVLSTSQFGFLNFHGSILPKYRGATPVQTAILNQDASTGVTVIKMDEGMDTGQILLTKETPIPPLATSGELMVHLACLSAELVQQEFETIFSPQNWHLIEQIEADATYCYVSDFGKEKLELLKSDSAKTALGKILAGNPEPKAWAITETHGKTIKVNLLNARLYELPISIAPLELQVTADKKLILGTKEGGVEILSIQPENKPVMDAKSFINGYMR